MDHEHDFPRPGDRIPTNQPHGDHPRGDDPADTINFDPAEEDWLADYEAATLRPRHDGWTAQRQYDFLIALAECGCVTEAAARVGKSAASAYALRRNPDATHFRRAWDAALDYAVQRLGDAAFARALNGTVRPVFYQGEQVGERRYYDERLTMFILRYRDPVRYGKWLDDRDFAEAPDAPARLAAIMTDAAFDDALAGEAGGARRAAAPIGLWNDADDPDYREAKRKPHSAQENARREAETRAAEEEVFRTGPEPENDSPPGEGN